jgi:hypothetical protein
MTLLTTAGHAELLKQGGRRIRNAMDYIDRVLPRTFPASLVAATDLGDPGAGIPRRI